ncbi:N-acetylglucosaminidase [Virgibacillus ihumii]|uniref:N-acetylglucosaminidase n=1 Tax=Virgibacillus ihumii TaxID=2686091 RepID=UPI00157D06B1|nr:GW dipeptide domain-containing protein [Virgibacillus ihumii]
MKKSLFIMMFLLIFSVSIPLQAAADSNKDASSDEGTVVTDETVETNKSTESGIPEASATDESQKNSGDTANDSEQDKAERTDDKEQQDNTNKEQKQQNETDNTLSEDDKVTSEEKQSSKKAEQKTDESNKTMQSFSVTTSFTKTAVSKMGRIQGSDARIYETIDGESFKAGSKYTERTFYIRKQAKGNGETYYLISTQKSSTDGVVGWVNAERMRVQTHSSVDSKAKTLYLDGTGWAYKKPWGATKDVLIHDLSPYMYNVFKVNLTEKVGKYIWYRGTLNGKTVWIQGFNAEAAKESPVSKAGRIQSENAVVYRTFGNATSKIKAGEKYAEKLYYIRKQIKVFGEVFYQLRENPGSGVVGWVNAKDIRTQQYTVINQDSQTLYLDGTGWTYSDPWGGAQDVIHTDLSPYKYLAFNVTREVKVGDYTWYRGTFDGNTVWIQGNNFLDKPGYSETDTSKIGRISKPDTIIYSKLNAAASMKKAGSSNTDSIVYIKKQAKISDRLYYLISDKRSSSAGVIGWVKADDIRTQSHQVVDTGNKTLYLDGTGWAYSDPWGGSKDVMNTDLTSYKYLKFNVNRTEKVGRYIWYHGDLNGENVWIQGYNFMKVDINESSASKIGRIQNPGTNVYGNIMQGTAMSTVGTDLTDKIFYIKKQATFNDQLFYKISNQRSSSKGVVGWVKSQDISVQSHSVANSKNFNYYLDGSGWSYSDPWGGAKDVISTELPKGELFKVTRTEKVGNYFWYKGTLNGETVWIMSFNVKAPEISSVSNVSRIDSPKAVIYKTIGDNSTSFTADQKYVDRLYYVKKQAKIFGEVYYQLSIDRNASEVVGWIKGNTEYARVQSHERVNSKNKSFYLDGSGWAYSDPWGGSKDVIYDDLSKYEENKALFEVNLTEEVGGYIWYRGTLDGRTVWIMSFNVLASVQEKTKYDLTLERMQEIQTALRYPGPQTDQGNYAWVYGKYVSGGEVDLDGGVLNIRTGPGTKYTDIGDLNDNQSVKVVDKVDGWYAIDVSNFEINNPQWGVFATPENVHYYLNPNNFTSSFRGKLQFLNLSYSANLKAAEVNNKILEDKGILSGRAQAFITAGREQGLNEIYLISHALLETGNGTSTLATGVPVDKNGNITRDSEGEIAKTGKTVATVYNMYGVGAIDGDALVNGAEYAFESGWTTPKKAIIGGAAFVSNNYVEDGQDTLYKMRWNPLFAANNGYASHQYATDIAWAYKQTARMYDLYNLISSYSLVFDIPMYR